MAAEKWATIALAALEIVSLLAPRWRIATCMNIRRWLITVLIIRLLDRCRSTFQCKILTSSMDRGVGEHPTSYLNTRLPLRLTYELDFSIAVHPSAQPPHPFMQGTNRYFQPFVPFIQSKIPPSALELSLSANPSHQLIRLVKDPRYYYSVPKKTIARTIPT